MRSGSRQKPVFLLFLLGIVVPSLLLGYLAFRGIRNDQVLVERERSENQRRTADLVARAVSDRIKATEEAFLAALSAREDGSDPATARRLDDFAAAHPLVEAVFRWERGETIRFPRAGVQFLAPGSTVPLRAAGSSASTSTRDPSAERLEFGQQDYPAALAAYQRALDRATDTQARGELASAVARVQKKAGRFPDAVASYQRLARDFDQVRTAGGIPLGLAARLELALLYAAMGDAGRALQTYADLSEALAKGAWPLEEAQYDFCVQQAGEGASRVLREQQADPQIRSHERRLQELKAQQEKYRTTAARLLAFSSNAAPSVGSQLRAKPGATDESFGRFALDADGHSYLVSLQRPRATGLAPDEAWGFLIASESLQEVLRQALGAHASPDDTAWVVRGADERIILASTRSPAGVSAVRARFEYDFPNWSLEFYALEPPRFTALLGSRQGIYLYMFLLIAGILVFGLILTVRTVSHEMDLARMKSDFVSTVSHEFKSPLTSIQQVAEMLHAGRIPSEDRRQQYYDLLLEQSQRLCLLTDNILNLAKIEEGPKRFAFERLDVGALLKEILPVVRDRVRHAGFLIELRLEEPLPEVLADADALAQAVTNLLDNAVKYSGQSRTVIVRAGVQERHVVVSVTDFGIGIRKDEVGRVFDRFYRGGNELTRAVKGSGLGLTLVKEIVEAHHGTVDVMSEPGQGSTFSVLLPVADKASGGRSPTPPTSE